MNLMKVKTEERSNKEKPFAGLAFILGNPKFFTAVYVNE